jgi:hypothetical protein
MPSLGELSPQERAKPYAKFYREAAPPPPEHARLLGNPKPMDPVKALPIQRMNELLDPGYHDVETGYCIMPDGSGYVAVLSRMPGVTVDMVRWWMAWFVLEDLRYKIWFPRDHKAVRIKDEDRAMLMDPTIPRERKIENPSPWHEALEDIGSGMASVQIDVMGPEDMGFDMSRFRAPYVATTVGGVATVLTSDGPPGYVSMVHFIREIPEGIEYRTRFWMGYAIKDRKSLLMLPTGVRIPEEAAAGLLEHDILEYSNLKVLLPEVYAEFGQAIQ